MKKEELYAMNQEIIVLFKFVIEKYMAISKTTGKLLADEVGTKAHNKCIYYGVNKGIGFQDCELLFQHALGKTKVEPGIVGKHIIIRLLREEANLSKDEFSKFMNVSIEKYEEIESGETDIKDKELLDIYKRLIKKKAFSINSIFNY